MSRSIIIENLCPSIDVTDLCEMFRKFGRILSANIETDSNLSSLCKGYISYDTPHSAFHAVKEMNGRNDYGRQIYVKLHQSMHKKSFEYTAASKPQSDNYKKIFVKNIDLSWDDYNLVGVFGMFGEIENAKVFRTDGKSNGYGFVTFQEHSSAKIAVETMNDKLISNQKLSVQPFMYDKSKSTIDSFKQDKEKPFQPNNLFIKNLPKDMDENELRELFIKFGPIQSIRIATDSTQKSKGYGFVCFYNDIIAAKAQKQMNGVSYKSKILEVSYYRKKSNNYPISDKNEDTKKSNIFYSTDKKTVFSFSAKG